MNTLKNLYYEQLITGQNELYRQASKQDPTITHNQVKDFVSQQKTSQIFAQPKTKSEHHIVAFEPNSNWQMDLIDLSRWKNENQGFCWLLNGIDIFTRKGFGLALKTKAAEEILNGFIKLISQNDKPKAIETDDGKEFTNSTFETYLTGNDIKHFVALVADHRHQGIIERFNKTLMSKLVKLQSINGNNGWRNQLTKLYSSYNSSVNRGIGMAPNQAGKHQGELLEQNINKNEVKENEFKEGQTVRLRKEKETFNKGYLPQFSEDAYEIEAKHGQKYKMKGIDNVFFGANDILPIKGDFQPKKEQIYVAEKIVGHKKLNGKLIYKVRWKGFGAKDDTWEPPESLRLFNKNKPSKLELNYRQ